MRHDIQWRSIRLRSPQHSQRSWSRLCIKFGALCARKFKQKHRGRGDIFFIDEVFVKIGGRQVLKAWIAIESSTGLVVNCFIGVAFFLKNFILRSFWQRNFKESGEATL